MGRRKKRKPIKDTKKPKSLQELERKKNLARELFCDQSTRRTVRQISLAVKTSMESVSKWRKEEGWDDIRKRMFEGVKEKLIEEGIKGAYLDTKMIITMQKDLVTDGKRLRSISKDAAYRAAAKLEELALKKDLLQRPANSNVGTILELLSSED